MGSINLKNKPYTWNEKYSHQNNEKEVVNLMFLNLAKQINQISLKFNYIHMDQAS